MRAVASFVPFLLMFTLAASSPATEPIGTLAPSSSVPVIQIIGVHRVEGQREPVALVEVLIDGYVGNVDLAAFGQDVPRLRRARSQVPWLEHELNASGTSGRDISLEPLVVSGRARLAFFLHYPQYGEPLKTPFGPVTLPQSTPLPQRLRFIRYEKPG